MDRASCYWLFNEQKTAFCARARVDRVHGLKQPFRADEPRLVLFVDVEHEHQILGGQVAPDGGMMPAYGPEERAAVEVDHVATGRVVHVVQVLAELRPIESPEQRDAAVQLATPEIRELVQREPAEADTQPALSGPVQNVRRSFP